MTTTRILRVANHPAINISGLCELAGVDENVIFGQRHKQKHTGLKKGIKKENIEALIKALHTLHEDLADCLWGVPNVGEK